MSKESEESTTPELLPIEIIERRILLIRGHKVMLDSHLAELYQVTTGNLNLAVRRNNGRFPEDFMFQLTKGEANSLLLQTAIANAGRGGRQTLPYVFTEQGVAMLSSVLNSKHAIAVNIAIMRVFVRLREMLASHIMLLRRLDDLEREQKEQGLQIGAVFEAIRKLATPEESESSKNPMGFQ
jgi:hypothetical protein